MRGSVSVRALFKTNRRHHNRVNTHPSWGLIEERRKARQSVLERNRIFILTIAKEPCPQLQGVMPSDDTHYRPCPVSSWQRMWRLPIHVGLDAIIACWTEIRWQWQLRLHLQRIPCIKRVFSHKLSCLHMPALQLQPDLVHQRECPAVDLSPHDVELLPVVTHRNAPFGLVLFDAFGVACAVVRFPNSRMERGISQGRIGRKACNERLRALIGEILRRWEKTENVGVDLGGEPGPALTAGSTLGRAHPRLELLTRLWQVVATKVWHRKRGK